MSTRDVSIRLFENGDEDMINQGFNQVFGKQRSFAEWSWKFSPIPYGRLIMIATDDHQVFTQYAAVETRFQVHGKEFPVAQVVDSYSTKQARKQIRPILSPSAFYLLSLKPRPQAQSIDVAPSLQLFCPIPAAKQILPDWNTQLCHPLSREVLEKGFQREIWPDS